MTTKPDIDALIVRLTAAGRDDRLATGALYLEAARALQTQQAEIDAIVALLTEEHAGMHVWSQFKILDWIIRNRPAASGQGEEG